MTVTKKAINCLEQDLKNENISVYGRQSIECRLRVYKKQEQLEQRREKAYQQRNLGFTVIDSRIANIAWRYFNGDMSRLFQVNDDDLSRVRNLGPKTLKRIQDLREQWERKNGNHQ